MAAPEVFQRFLREHSEAWQFASKASDDYLLARFGILNALWSGFEVATMAVEKLLKSYLLFADKSFGGDANKVRKAVSTKSKSLSRNHATAHDVEACLSLAKGVGLICSEGLQPRLARINEYYSWRYPDNCESASVSTSEINEVDESVLEVWDAFEGINADYFYTGGIMTPVYAFEIVSRNNGDEALAAHPYSVMIESNNAFETRRATIEDQIRMRLDTWYPKVH